MTARTEQASRERELERLIECASQEPGVQELMEVYGPLRIAQDEARRARSAQRVRVVTTASSST